MDGSFYRPKVETKWNVISLGAGVQSSTLALMAARGEITPMPDFAVFADTQAEPASVYKWLDWLKVELAPAFPVYTVSRGCLTTESLTLRTRKDGSGHWTKGLIPAFVLNADGTKGILGRLCTAEYKVNEILRHLRRMAGIRRGQTEVTVTQWIGISSDEQQRMKNPPVKWCQNRWPLIELGMKRRDCLAWMDRNGYPTPPRSACVYCPFHSDAEWRRLRDEEPAEFAKAVQFERDLQASKAQTDKIRGVPYLHSSLVPLAEVKFKTDADQYRIGDWTTEGLLNECEGLCGI